MNYCGGCARNAGLKQVIDRVPKLKVIDLSLIHIYQHQAQHLGHPDGLAGDGPVEQIQAVGAQTLDPEAAHAVPQEVEAGVLTVESPGLGYHKNDQQQADEVPQALVQEGGMYLHQLPGSGGQLHAPGHGGFRTKGLAVQEIAPAADGLADEQPHDHQVHHGPQLDMAAAAQDNGHDDHSDDAAVDGQAAVPDGDGLGPAEPALVVLELAEIEQNVIDPRADDAAGNAPCLLYTSTSISCNKKEPSGSCSDSIPFYPLPPLRSWPTISA